MRTIETEVVELLKTEHDLLMRADFANLPSIAAKKEVLIMRLSSGEEKQNPTLMAEIKTSAQRNAQLYDSALAGLGQAIERISGIRSTLGKIKTYDDRGSLTTTSTNDPSISVKA